MSSILFLADWLTLLMMHITNYFRERERLGGGGGGISLYPFAANVPDIRALYFHTLHVLVYTFVLIRMHLHEP